MVVELPYASVALMAMPSPERKHLYPADFAASIYRHVYFPLELERWLRSYFLVSSTIIFLIVPPGADSTLSLQITKLYVIAFINLLHDTLVALELV